MTEQTFDVVVGSGAAGQRFPRRWLESGAAVSADTIAWTCPAHRSGPAGLARMIERFNGFARSGIDDDFHRGESAYDKCYGDPGVGARAVASIGVGTGSSPPSPHPGARTRRF